ncbi:MAG: gluconokinase [Gemmatimonadaceae bacterium]
MIVVMGIAGAGKTTVGRALATSLGWAFDDADDFHPAANVEKMRAGVPLDDADRAPWLATLRVLIERRVMHGEHGVLACSALKQSYREALRPGAAPRDAVAFVHLDVAPLVAERRLAERRGHYMQASLVASQIATLEPPHDALCLDAELPVPELVARIRRALAN